MSSPITLDLVGCRKLTQSLPTLMQNPKGFRLTSIGPYRTYYGRLFFIYIAILGVDSQSCIHFYVRLIYCLRWRHAKLSSHPISETRVHLDRRKILPIIRQIVIGHHFHEHKDFHFENVPINNKRIHSIIQLF